jgi:glycogen operon protein
MGSPDLYYGRGTSASINFITCHDGFTLYDMVAYNEKHNDANGEDNRDGANDNESWNCGAEGPTDDPGINALRTRQIKNAVAMLMVSQGVPMLLMGDEMGRTQGGNNNAYCHDNDLSWLDWGLLDRNQELFRFVQQTIAFRKQHHVLRNPNHLTGQDSAGCGYAEVTWHGTGAWNADWSSDSRIVAFMLSGRNAAGSPDDDVYVAINMHWDGHTFALPGLPQGRHWHLFANTGAAAPGDVWQPGEEPLLETPESVFLGPRSVLIAVTR